jgi:hypothetical protein
MRDNQANRQLRTQAGAVFVKRITRLTCIAMTIPRNEIRSPLLLGSIVTRATRMVTAISPRAMRWSDKRVRHSCSHKIWGGIDGSRCKTRRTPQGYTGNLDCRAHTLSFFDATLTTPTATVHRGALSLVAFCTRTSHKTNVSVSRMPLCAGSLPLAVAEVLALRQRIRHGNTARMSRLLAVNSDAFAEVPTQLCQALSIQSRLGPISQRRQCGEVQCREQQFKSFSTLEGMRQFLTAVFLSLRVFCRLTEKTAPWEAPRPAFGILCACMVPENTLHKTLFLRTRRRVRKEKEAATSTGWAMSKSRVVASAARHCLDLHGVDPRSNAQGGMKPQPPPIRPLPEKVLFANSTRDSSGTVQTIPAMPLNTPRDIAAMPRCRSWIASYASDPQKQEGIRGGRLTRV